MKKFIFFTVCAFALMIGAASCSTKATDENDTVGVTDTMVVDSVEVDTVATDSVAL